MVHNTAANRLRIALMKTIPSYSKITYGYHHTMCKEIKGKKLIDRSNTHAWIWEPRPSGSKGTFTDDGLENIAAHEYKGGHYTFMDAAFNPIWTSLTELLPMWLAPNMVTFIGAMHCGLAYGLYWYYSPEFDAPLPSWLIFLAGYCTIAYYTFDCMDGKQARRTGHSSPLGQLFDHGFDCICNLAHVSGHAGMLKIGRTVWFHVLHSSIFFAFFMAQWEEYYTGELPHAMGNFGVTEANYGMGLFLVINAFLDREKMWMEPLRHKIPASALNFVESNIGLNIPDKLLELEMKSVGLFGWILLSVVLISGSFQRVLSHANVTKNGLQLTALSKLLTPFLIILAPLLLPENIFANNTRFLSVSSGLLMSMLTKKMICFSMAKQTFASIQIEAIPFWAICLWIRLDENITEEGAKVLLGTLCVWYAYRLLNWASAAIGQICERLDINCFTIKEKKVDDADAWKKVHGKEKSS